MHLADEFTLIRLPPFDPEREPFGELHVRGVATGKTVPGAGLEAAVGWRDFTLLFVTDDCPYEETLRILLLDARLDVVDAASIGTPYATGLFSDVRLLPPAAVGFRFLGAFDWTVTLLPRPGWRLPWLFELAGVRRCCGYRRHFVVGRAAGNRA